MATVPSAPVNVPMKDANGNMSQAWMLWFEAIDKRITEVNSGGAGGDVVGTPNTGFSVSSTGNIYINGILLQLPTHESQIAYTTGTTLGWVSPETLAATPVGTIRPYMDDTLPEGWIVMNDGTIGSASSGATNRANADCSTLYTQIWNGVSNTYAPVSSGRGASAAADFAANKTIQLGFMAGRSPKIMAGTGTLGVTNGAESVTMSLFQLPEHHHTLSAQKFGSGVINDGLTIGASVIKTFDSIYSYTSFYDNLTSRLDSEWPFQFTGGTDAQAVIQPTVYFKYMIKL